MISEVDINDWEMLVEPLELNKVNVNELFSIKGSDHVFKHCGNFADAVHAARMNTQAMYDYFLLPDFLKVYKWVQK